MQFKIIAKEKKIALNELATEIDNARGIDIGLASAIRLYILHYITSKN
jgi:predicted DNA-binding ribbon-helix-helix protein